MSNPFHSVRFRLFALCASLLAVLGGANFLLNELIQRHEDRQLHQQEQYRRVETIHAAQRAMTTYRRWQGNLNAAILTKNRALRVQPEQEVTKALAALRQSLLEVERFDPNSVKTIRASLDVLPAIMRSGIAALVNPHGPDVGARINQVTHHLDAIEETLYSAVQRELALAHEAERQELERSREGRRLSLLIFGLSAGVGLLVTWIILRSIIRPLQTTVTAIRQVNAGETQLDLPPLTDDEFGDMAVALRQFRDQTEHLRRLAYNDPLTGLGNRARLEQTLSAAIELCRRRGGDLALLYVDLDNFSNVNDSLGHSAGDRYLCEAAVRLQRFAPPEALVCRYSGDKFTVLLEELSSDDPVMEVRVIADRILRGMAEPVQFGGKLLPMSVSIGIALHPADGDTGEQLISSADAAMYCAKQSGRNLLQFATPALRAGLRQQMEVAADIRRGLEQGEFEPFYQPVVDVEDGRVVSAEALLRWRHPERGIVPAGEFIPAAEESGLIHALGERCLREASEQAQRWVQESRSIRVSVNLSPRQIEDGSVIRLLEALHKRSEGQAISLDFEITETAMLERGEQTQEILKRVKAYGHRLGMDDFGTGYSSMLYVQRLPLDRLKIDRSFVARVETSREAQAIISATVALAKSLDLEVIAEGVETATQMRRLREMGCILQQGFYFTAALPSAEFVAWMDARQRPLAEAAALN